MTVIYRQNILLSFLRRIPTKLRFSLSLILFFSVVFFWFIFFYYPLLVKNEQSRFELQKLSEQQNINANIFKIESENESLRSDISKFISSQSESGQLPFLINKLKKFKLTCKSAEPELIKLNKKNRMKEKEYFNLSIKGEFNNFVDFFNSFKDLDNLIKFKSLDFSLNKNNKIKLLAKIKFLNFEKNEE